MTGAAAMSDRDLLIQIANDSDHTKKSVDKLWEKSDDLNTTVSELTVTQKATTKSVDTISEALFTGPDALSPRVKVLEEKKPTGSSGFMSAVKMPSVKPSAPDSSASNSMIKVLGGVVVALVTIVGTLIAAQH